MPKAIWNGQVIAEAETSEIEMVEGNVYFPPSSLNMEFFKDSSHSSVCPWKGTAGYFHVEVDGELNQNAAWIYRSPSDAAKQIKDHVAFWKGVQVSD